MANFVLIHGAFRGGWAWERVVPLLEAAGHRVVAPTLSNDAQTSLYMWADEIKDTIEARDLADVMLVGHSQGGIVAQAAAEIIPQRVARIIFLDSPVLRNGEAAIDVFPAEVRRKMPPVSLAALIEPMPVVANEFVSAADAQWMNERLTSQPARPGFDRLRIDRSAQIPHTYIFCRPTNAFYPSAHTRARFDLEGGEYSLIDAPHDCNVTHPGLVARLIASWG